MVRKLHLHKLNNVKSVQCMVSQVDKKSEALQVSSLLPVCIL